MSYVIACGDEGVQLNQGTRLGVVGAGIQIPHIDAVIKGLKKVLKSDLFLASNEESDWIKTSFQLDEWEQANATMQQHAEALCDREGVKYVGYLTFTDPRELEADIKGHMVRPHGVHVAKRICFTVGGGEQKYNLGNYVISAEWVSAVKSEIAREVLQTQIEFYRKIAKKPLEFIFEMGGELGEKTAEKNKAIVEELIK